MEYLIVSIPAFCTRTLHGHADVWLVSGEIGEGKSRIGLIDGQIGDRQADVGLVGGQVGDEQV